jgi:hypothetical protein
MHKFLSLIIGLLLIPVTNIIAQCDPGQSEVGITIVPDNYPNETSWELRNAQTNALLASGTSNSSTVCVSSSACLRFTIFDSYGDGICCAYGSGSYAVTLNGDSVANGGLFTHYETSFFNCPPGYACSDPIAVQSGIYSTPVNNTWYSFKPDSIGTYSITTCGLSNCDTKIWVYDACNGLTWDNTNLGTLFYDDNSGGCGLQALVTAFLDSAVTYYIRIGGADSMSCPGLIGWELDYLGPVVGCMDPNACNYSPLATVSDGNCIYPGNPNCPNAPDLLVLQSTLQSSLVQDQLTAENCQVNEGCLTGYGLRDIIRFTTHIKNIGESDYYIGDPTAHPDQFTWDPCHQHWHYVGYAEYLLFDMNGNAIPVGYKNGFCVLDLECSGGGTAQYGCGNMGISAGCGDIYSSGLPCQWIDITDVDTGKYQLVIRVNWDQSPDALGRIESDYDNNWAQACIRLSRDISGNPMFSLESNCPIFTDCNGVAFGNTQMDCSGVCGGTAVRGDLNADTVRTITDAQLYNNRILNDNINPTDCNDLNADGNITVYDAALLQNCVQNGAPNNNRCTFPRGLTNPNDTVALSITSVNLNLKYVDIAILNPTYKVTAYQFSISGIKILSVQNMVNPVDYPISPEFLTGGDEIIGFSYDGKLIDKNFQPSALCRVFYSELTDTAICISKITDIVNQNYEASVTRIDGPCFQHTFTGITDPNSAIACSIYPNPAASVLNVSFSTANPQNLTIELIDALGKIVYVRQLQQVNEGNIPVPVTALPSGVYTIKVSGKSIRMREKVIITR